MDNDPRLREASQKDSKAYNHNQTLYTLNPIRLPFSQYHSAGLPSLRQEIGHPYYAVQQEFRPSSHQPPLPASQPHEHARLLHPVHGLADPKNELKRPRACEACRGLKVKCVPEPDGKCKRCAKSGRPCVVTAPSRKRQKKPDSRVAELEQKIDALTASLQATRSQQVNGSDDDTSGDNYEGEILSSSRLDLQSQQSNGHHNTSSWQEGLTSNTPVDQNLSQKRRRSAHHDIQDRVESNADGNTTPLRNGTVSKASETPQTSAPGEWPTPNIDAAQAPPAGDLDHGHGNLDAIDRQLLDAETAAKIFRHYMENMSPHMPAVVFSPTTDPGVVRKQKPILFLAILSVAAGDYPDIQKLLLKEVTRRYADCLIYKNHKSLDIIQALQISTIWYSPEEYRDAKQYQLILNATTIGIAIGLGQLGRPVGAFSLGWKELRYASKTLTDEAGMAERRRAWVSCYILCGMTATSLRLPNLLRWNSYMEECIQSFETSPHSLPSDLVLGKWAKLQKLKDAIAIQYETEDAFTPSGLTGLETEKNFSAFKEQLDRWEEESDNSSASLALAFNISRMHMFHIQVRLSYCPDAVEESHPLSADHKAAKSWDVPNPSESDTVQNFIRCIHNVLEGFLSFTVAEVRTIPTFHFIRVAYAVVCLLRLNRGARKVDSELGRLISADSLKVDNYITRLFKLMQSAAADGKSRPAQTFQSALTTIKTRFKREPDNGCSWADDDATSHVMKPQPVDTETDTSSSGYKKANTQNNEVRGPCSSDTRPQHRHYRPQEPVPQYQSSESRMNNSPLHLLSQIATGDPPGSVQHLVSNAGSGGWYNSNYPSYPAHDPNVLQTPYAVSNSAYYSNPASYSDANFAGNVPMMYQGVNTGAGFQHAIGVQYGQEMDLCAMFMDNKFLPPIGTGGFEDWEEKI